MPPTIESEIEKTADELLQGRVAATVSRFAVVAALERLAHRVKQDAELNVLMNLLTVEDVARQLGVTPARVRAKAIWLRKRGFSPGWQVPGTRAWLFRPEELENLKPLPARRPRRDELPQHP